MLKSQQNPAIEAIRRCIGSPTAPAVVSLPWRPGSVVITGILAGSIAPSNPDTNHPALALDVFALPELVLLNRLRAILPAVLQERFQLTSSRYLTASMDDFQEG